MTPIAKALTPRRSNTTANNNFNNKNPRFDQENLENNSKISTPGPSTPLAKNNGSIKAWNRSNSSKALGKG